MANYFKATYESSTMFTDRFNRDITTEASTLGLDPGTWPNRIDLVGFETTFEFFKTEIEWSRQDLSGVRYETLDGQWSLTVWND